MAETHKEINYQTIHTSLAEMYRRVVLGETAAFNRLERTAAGLELPFSLNPDLTFFTVGLASSFILKTDHGRIGAINHRGSQTFISYIAPELFLGPVLDNPYKAKLAIRMRNYPQDHLPIQIMRGQFGLKGLWRCGDRPVADMITRILDRVPETVKLELIQTRAFLST